MSDLLRAMAFAYRRKGVDAMPGGELRLLLAYDLRWFAPEDAKRAVARAIEAGLLRDEDGILHAAFDARAIDIPLNFRPSASVLDDPLPAAPAARIPAPAPLSELDRAAEDERRRRGLMLSIDAARLVVRRRAGDDVAADAAALEAAILGAKSA